MASHKLQALVAAAALIPLLASIGHCNAQGAATPAPKGGATSAVCPITGKAPVKPDGPLPRCQAEQDLACCTQCEAAGSAVSTLSKNGSAILGFLRTSDPSLAPLFASFQKSLGGKPLCSLFEKNGQCLNMIEALSCALNCDAKAASFLTVREGNGTMRVCDGFAKQLYDACSTMSIPNLDQTIGDNIENPQDLLTAIVDPLVASATPLADLTSTVVPTKDGKCFNGPTNNAYPTTNLCCDPLTSVPDSCFQTQVVSKVSATTSTNLQTLVNRPLPKGCPAAGKNSTATSGGSASQNSKGAAKAMSAVSVLGSLVLGTAALLAFGL